MPTVRPVREKPTRSSEITPRPPTVARLSAKTINKTFTIFCPVRKEGYCQGPWKWSWRLSKGNKATEFSCPFTKSTTRKYTIFTTRKALVLLILENQKEEKFQFPTSFQSKLPESRKLSIIWWLGLKTDPPARPMQTQRVLDHIPSSKSRYKMKVRHPHCELLIWQDLKSSKYLQTSQPSKRKSEFKNWPASMEVCPAWDIVFRPS